MMGSLARGLISPLGQALGLFPKKPTAVAAPVALPTVSASAAADAATADRADDLRRRRGAGANELTGGGAEAITPGAKTLLGQ